MKILETLQKIFAKGPKEPKPIIPNETTKKAILEARNKTVHHHNHGSSTT